MSSVYRRITILLAVACLGASLPATVAHAQGAGDQQYQDPFGNSSGSSGSGSSGSSGSGSSGSSAQSTPGQSLSSTPQATAAPSATAGTSAAATSATSAAQTSGAGTLPNTGIDVRVVLAGGAALLLLGLGLRRRSAPER
jgi:LPXTG-motif cell wall-anchored protein